MRDDPFGGGVVDLLVLSAIGRAESYGYAIAQHLAGHGVSGLSEASVYASLRRLEDKGLLESRHVLADNGKARRYYALTREGDAHRVSGKESWEATSRAVQRVLAAADEESGR